MKTFYIDQPFIDNKYHKVNEPFNPYNRMAYHGYDYDESTGLSDAQILEGLRAMESELDSLPRPVAKARAIKYVLENTRIDVNPHDYFVGFYSVNRLANTVCLTKWEKDAYEHELKDCKTLMNKLKGSNAADIWPDFDHVIPDWQSIMSLGFSGLRARAAAYREKHRADGTLTPEMDAHFEGMDIEYSAIIDVINRMYEYACRLTHEKAATTAKCLKNVRDGAPTDIYEAMQTVFIYFMVSECFDSYQVRSLGNGLDGTLYPFYKRDLERGTYTREEIKELLAYFLYQWSSIGNYWGQPFYMGGTNPDGTTKYNDLSRDILDIYDELGIYNPKMQLKINDNIPDDILYKAFDMIRRGHNCFALCCEPGHVKAVMSYGATYEEALGMDISGCYETKVRANEASPVAGYVNALKAVEYVFSDGFDKELNEQFGVRTGALDKLKTFDDFYFAVLKQWERVIENVIVAANDFEKYLSRINPSLTYSATIEYSLNKGEDAYQTGAKFSNSALLNCGMASLVDAVMAVKSLVYDEKVTTLDELKAALDADWTGYENLRAKARRCVHKYGNGDETADKYAVAMGAYFAHKVNNRPNGRGGVYKACMHSAMEFVWQGQRTAATPDGRRAGEEMSKNGSPSVGMDVKGVTALISSVLKMRPYTYPESFCLDVMLHPSAVSGDEGLQIMKALLFTYMNGGGMTMQINVFNSEKLRDAQKNPDKYKNLQVRVCGWNVLWNNLSTEEQNAYIERAENMQR